jgi:spermidine synthase
MPPSQAPLRLVVFIAGLSTMATEMLTARLLAPFYGTSLLIWSFLLFSILLALTIGYVWGGRSADRDPRTVPLARRLLAASSLLALGPLLCRGLLNACQAPPPSLANLVLGLVGTVAFLCVPVTLLATTGPFVIRLRAKDPALMGQGAGAILGLSTLGSIAGTYLPALAGIPWLGTIRSFEALAALAGAAAWSIWERRRAARLAVFAAGVALPLALMAPNPGLLRPNDRVEVVFEGETVYNTVQVWRHEVADAGKAPYKRNMLVLNEGYAVHSITIDDGAWCFPLVGSVWDYMGLLPALCQPEGSRLDVAIVGLAGGTVARQILALFKGAYSIAISGAELDPLILKVARVYFALPGEVEGHAMDGRTFLARSRQAYDIVVTDAYRQPYIPFHLTTVEYFTLVRDHLKPRGMCSINVGATGPHEPILAKILSTMRTVFAEVFIFEVPRTTPLFANFLVLASKEAGVIRSPLAPGRTLGARVQAAFPQVPIRDLMAVWDRGLKPAGPADPSAVLTDDRAPVEFLTDAMILRALANPGLKIEEISH